MTTSKPTNQPADRNRLPNAVTRRLFLSCVSHEFRFYRDILATHLSQPGVELRRQEDFVNTGRTTLEKLDDYIGSCDAVIHLVGYGTGSYPMPAELQTLQSRLPDFNRRIGWDPAVPLAHLSYTQWEAWLAIYHAKPLALFRAADVAQRELGFVRDDRQRAEQDQHWRRLEALGRDRKEFVSPHDLSIEVLRALPLLVPGFQDNIQQGQTRDRNLLFAVLALQDEMLSRGSFVEICKRWVDDMQVPLADLMLREGLIDAADRALVEARVERKLKARGGDVRQSLADSLGTDARQSLGEALDAQTWANLPDRLAGLAGRETTATSWRYRLTRTHGIGGLGVVSVAQDCGLERDVAIKQLKADRLLDPMAIDRFIREARITGQLQHPNIIPVYELGLTPGDQVPFYAMRFVGHRTLHDAIAHHHTDTQVSAREKNLRFRNLIQAFIAVCNAVAYAHEQKVIHRDIKPANVMIGDFGEVILLDWGLAKRIDEVVPGQEVSGEELVAGPAGQTRSGARLGSPAYMAPEQAAGQIDQHGPLTDVYGLGATLYELLTGDVPFSGTTTEELFTAIQSRTAPAPHSRNPTLSPALSAICLQAMAKRPQDRYASARDLATDLLQWLADEPVTAYPEPWAARAQRLARKYPGPLSATAATVLVGALGLGLGLYRVNIERGKAVAAQTEAEQNFLLARDTVNGFVTSISRDELSVVPGMQDLRVSMARKAREQNEIFAANRPTDPQVIAALGESRVNYSQVLLSIGPVDAAVAEALRGVAELEQAAQRDASDDLQVRWARGLCNVSDLYRELGQYSQALPYVHKAMEILEPRGRSQDKRTDIQYELARGLNILGNCLSESNERIVAYERARNLASAILETHSRPAAAHQVYAAATFNLANRFYDNADAQRKLELLQQAYQADQKVLEQIPNAPQAVSNMSLGLEETGATLANLGRFDEARQTFDLAEDSGRKVVAQNPKANSAKLGGRHGRTLRGALSCRRGPALPNGKGPARTEPLSQRGRKLGSRATRSDARVSVV